MPSTALKRMTDLPNVGPALARDLAALSLDTPAQLVGREPLEIFRSLAPVMGRRHDPCVLYTLMSVENYLATGVARPWWTFTAEGKRLLAVK